MSAYEHAGRSHVEHGASRSAGAPEPAELTPDERAGQVRMVADNLRRQRAAVEEAIGMVAAAETPAKHAAAATRAQGLIAQLRDRARRAADFAGASADPACTAEVAGALAEVSAAESRLAEIAAPPSAREATSRGLSALREVLPPSGSARRQDGPHIVRPILAALHDVEFLDLGIVRAALGGGGELGPRFALLSEAVRRQLAFLLNDNQFVQQRRFEHEARLELPRSAPAATQVDATLTVEPDPPDATHAVASELGAQLGVAPALTTGEAGREATESRGARGVAEGATVALHPDVDAATTDGRATIAHELIHQAQAQLPPELDAGRDAAETEAAQLATAAASGAAVVAPTRAIDLTRPAADRDAKPASAGGGRSSSPLGAAAGGVTDAVEQAQLAIALHKTFIDADVERVKTAVLALADVVHTHSGRVGGGDGRAIDAAVTAAIRLADALTIGPNARSRHGHELRKTVAALQHLLDDPRNDEPSRTPRELIPMAADNLARLDIARSHVAARILDYSSADLHGLDAAIAETKGWITELSGERGSKAAARLSRAIEEQAEVVAEVAPELEAFFRQPLTESSDEVVAAYVSALASSTRRHDRAAKSVARAKALRQRQRFDQPRAVIDGNLGDVVALGEMNRDEGAAARRDQRRLERRVDALERRAQGGGKVSNLDRDALLVEAREQSFRRHLRVLELQLRATADGIDGLDDGFLGGINRYSDDIPNMVSDLRGIARVTVAAVKGYGERVAIIEAEADEEPDESHRHRKIADGKLAALDEMTRLVVEQIENGRLTERLTAAEKLAKRAQTRLFIANLLATIALTLAGNLAAAAARGAAEGVWIARAGAAGVDAAEIAQGAKIVGTVAGGAADLAVNTVGQKVVLGDERSWLTVLGSNGVSMLASQVVSTRFVKIEPMIDDVNGAVRGWRAIAPTLSTNAKKLAASFPELSLSMIVGAAADHALTRAAGYEVPPADHDELVSQWMAQGAAMAIGRHIAVHSQSFRKLTVHLEGGARRWAHARALAMDLDVRAAGAMHSGDLAHAHAALIEYEALLAVERAAIAEQLEREHPNRRLDSDTLEPATKAHADDAGTARDELPPLPRTRPDREAFSDDGVRENAAAIARGEPGYNQVVGHIASHAEGVALMQRLMRGDTSALAEVGYSSEGAFDPSTREWGLGKLGDKYVLIAGEHGAVDWSVVKGVTPIGHSHPIDTGRTKTQGDRTLDVRAMVSKSDAHNLDAALFFASPDDLRFVATARLREHVIPLPYEHIGGTEVALASKTPSGRTRLVLVLENATFLGTFGDDGAQRFSSRAVVRAGDEVVWQGQIDAVFPPGKDSHLEFDVANRGARRGDAPTGDTTKSRTASPTDENSHEPGVLTAEPDVWISELKASLTPEELAQYALMKGKWGDASQTQSSFAGDLAAARTAIRVELAGKARSQGARNDSARRVAELRRFADDHGLFDASQAKEILAGLSDPPTKAQLLNAAQELRTVLISEVRTAEALAAHPDKQILNDVKVLELTEMSLDEFSSLPRQRKHGLMVRDGRIFREVTDIDALWLEPIQGGPSRIARMEQQKTGKGDTHADAARQNSNAMSAMSDPGRIRLEVDGRDITKTIDLTTASTAEQVTAGPALKQFDESLGITATDLERLVRDLLAEKLQKEAPP